MQIERLIQIVFLLLSRDNLTAKQLAEELGVFTRTSYRDINILSVAGIPITSQKGYGGGLSLPQDFSLTPAYKEEYNIPIFKLHFAGNISEFGGSSRYLLIFLKNNCPQVQSAWHNPKTASNVTAA